MSETALPLPAHGGETFRELLRERLISVRTMDRRLRLVVGAAVAQLLVAAIMVALRGADMPRILGDVTDGVESNIPVATFVVATSFIVVAWTFILAGALHAHWTLRLLVVGLFSWSLWVERDVPAQTTAGNIAAAVLLGIIIAVTLLTIVRDRNAGAPSARLLGARIALLLPLVAGLFIDSWLSAQSADQLELFTTSVSDHLYNLEYALIPLLVLAGADFADWGHVLGSRGAHLLERAHNAWPLLLAVAAVGGALLADGLRVLDSGDLPRMLAMSGVLGITVAVVTWVVRARQTWPAHFPFLALAGVVVVDSTMGFLVDHFWGGSDEAQAGDRIYAVTAAVWLGLAVLSLLVLVVRPRLRPAVTATLAFVVLIGVCDVLFGLASIQTVFTSLHLSDDTVSLSLDGVRAGAGALTLLVCAVLLLRRRLRQDAWMLGLLMALDVGVQVLAWADQLFDRTAHLSESKAGPFSVGAAIVLLVALLLELLASGDAITNGHGRWLPRPSRVLLYLGYILMVAAAVLYFSSLYAPDTGALRESMFDSEQWVQEGVIFLGPPLVLALFAGGVARRSAGARDE